MPKLKKYREWYAKVAHHDLESQLILLTTQKGEKYVPLNANKKPVRRGTLIRITEFRRKDIVCAELVVIMDDRSKRKGEILFDNRK